MAVVGGERSIYTAVVALILAACFMCGCGSGRVVAVVAGHALLSDELDRWTSAITSADAGSARGGNEERTQALGLMIFSLWLKSEAHEEGLSVSETQVAKSLGLLRLEIQAGSVSRWLSREPVLRRLLLSSRLATPDRLWLMRDVLLEGALDASWRVRAARSVHAKEIAEFYDHHKRLFLLPQHSEIEILGSYSRRAVVRAKHEIDSGKPFLTVAHTISIDGEAPEGLQDMVRGTDEAQEEDVVFAAQPHVLEGPYKYLFYFLFEVLKATPAHQQTLHEAEDAVRRRLASTLVSTKLVNEFELKWTAQTDCRPGYVISRCRQHRAAASPGG